MVATSAGFPAVVSVGEPGGVAASSGLIASSDMNSTRISNIMDALSHLVRSHFRSADLFHLCLLLARQIDSSVANHIVPNRALELPSLLEKVCVLKMDTFTHAALMVLMISVKSASQTRWFSNADSEKLSNMAKEIASSYCSISNFSSEPSCSNSIITSIMSRFYPRMRMGHMFFFIDVKPGFDAYVRDFQISPNLKSCPGDKVRLFVGQTDSIATSSCLISPSKVNFLVNGHGVEGRTNLCMDTGPQIPTILTHLLEFGSNLLQAVGEFDGNYIIAIACMSEMPNPGANVLQDYEHATPIVDSDSEIIEGASRISLNCPISFRRIKTPVKGHSCKHIQCFDFDNYLDINSRRPSWRCPHCNRHVCFSDLRIDQKMVKILKEVGTSVTDVIFSSDGSWNAVMETDRNRQKSEDATSSSGQNESPRSESVGLLNVPSHVLDLTREDDSMEVFPHETEDRKLSSTVLQNQPLMQTMAVDPYTTNANDESSSVARAEDDSWYRIYMSTFGLRPPNFTLNTRPGIIASNAIGSMPVSQSGTSLSSNMPPQQYQFGDPTIANEYGRFPSVPEHVSGTPITVQDPPRQTLAPVLQQTPTSSVNAYMNGCSAAHQAYPAVQRNTNSTIVSSLLHVSPSSLNQYPQNGSQASIRPHLQNVTQHAPNHVPNAYRGVREPQIPSQQMMNQRRPLASSQSHCPIQSTVQPPTNFFRPASHMGVSQDRIGRADGITSDQRAQLIAAANRSMHMALGPSRTLETPTYSMNPGASSGPSVGDNGTDPVDQNWRPAGRMRGALSGQAFTDALNEYIIRPSQQAQAARHISNANSLPNSVAPNTIFHG